MKRSTERELLLKVLRADAELPSELARRLDRILSEVDPAKRAQAFQELFEELAG